MAGTNKIADTQTATHGKNIQSEKISHINSLKNDPKKKIKIEYANMMLDQHKKEIKKKKS